MATREHTELATIEHLDFDIQCESPRCQKDWNRGAHAADYDTTLTCGCQANLCADRVSFTCRMLLEGRVSRCPWCNARGVDWARLIPIRNQV